MVISQRGETCCTQPDVSARGRERPSDRDSSQDFCLVTTGVEPDGDHAPVYSLTTIGRRPPPRRGACRISDAQFDRARSSRRQPTCTKAVPDLTAAESSVGGPAEREASCGQEPDQVGTRRGAPVPSHPGDRRPRSRILLTTSGRAGGLTWVTTRTRTSITSTC